MLNGVCVPCSELCSFNVLKNAFLKVLSLEGSIAIVKVSLGQGQCQSVHACHYMKQRK